MERILADLDEAMRERLRARFDESHKKNSSLPDRRIWVLVAAQTGNVDLVIRICKALYMVPIAGRLLAETMTDTLSAQLTAIHTLPRERFVQFEKQCIVKCLRIMTLEHSTNTHDSDTAEAILFLLTDRKEGIGFATFAKVARELASRYPAKEMGVAFSNTIPQAFNLLCNCDLSRGKESMQFINATSEEAYKLLAEHLGFERWRSERLYEQSICAEHLHQSRMSQFHCLNNKEMLETFNNEVAERDLTSHYLAIIGIAVRAIGFNKCLAIAMHHARPKTVESVVVFGCEMDQNIDLDSFADSVYDMISNDHSPTNSICAIIMSLRAIFDDRKDVMDAMHIAFDRYVAQSAASGAKQSAKRGAMRGAKRIASIARVIQETK